MALQDVSAGGLEPPTLCLKDGSTPFYPLISLYITSTYSHGSHVFDPKTPKVCYNSVINSGARISSTCTSSGRSIPAISPPPSS